MAEAEVIDLAARRRLGAEAPESVIERAVHEILLAAQTKVDAFAAMRGLAASLVDRGVFVDDVAQVAMLVMQYMIEQGAEGPTS